MAKTKKKAKPEDPSKPLPNKSQEQFCLNILKGMKQGPAYAAVAAYTSKNPDSQACLLIRNPKITARIAFLSQQVADKAVVDVSYVLKGFKNVAERCQQAEEVKVKVDGELVGTGEYVFDSSGANKALDSIGKHVGFYEKDNDQRKAQFVLEIS